VPELPDIELYLHALRPRTVGRRVESVRAISPFVLRTFDPPIDACEGKRVESVERLGKRFVFALESDVLIVTHLMIAGRWRWSDDAGSKPPGKITLASLVLESGVLHLVESSQNKRASIHVHRRHDDWRGVHDRGGIDVRACSRDEFAARLTRENHTVKRCLTDPSLFDGIGNAYSDEILHDAKLSPIRLTKRLSEGEIDRLHASSREILTVWTRRLIDEFAGRFPGPGEVTAFRPDFAVHGKFGKPCPVCALKVQRIRYADNETNYCAGCQTEGKLLADRSLSRLLKGDWPKSIEEVE
jgi:formamidopyrimidine-DNA glycosylase